MSAAASVAREKPSLPRRIFAFFALELLDNRYPALHGLRVLAIVTVVQYHVTAILSWEEHLALNKDMVDSSLAIFFGMDLFFVLSGFLIGSILLHSLEKPGGKTIRRFYMRRAFRTFPSYYVVLTVLALTSVLTVMQKKHLPFEYVYLSNFFDPTRTDLVMLWGWSLALEEQFYLVVPLLFLVLHFLRSDRLRVVFLSVLWSAALVTRIIIYLRHVGPWHDLEIYGALYFRTHTRYDTLVAGVLLALVHNRYGAKIGRWLGRPFSRALLALPSLACLWLLLRPWMFGDKYVQIVHLFAWGTITSVMYFGMLLLLLHGGGWIHRLLSANIFRRLATVGYGVYLVHIPLCDRLIVPLSRALDARHWPALAVWSVCLAALLVASFATGYVMHVIIEKPSMWLRNRFAA